MSLRLAVTKPAIEPACSIRVRFGDVGANAAEDRARIAGTASQPPRVAPRVERLGSARENSLRAAHGEPNREHRLTQRGIEPIPQGIHVHLHGVHQFLCECVSDIVSLDRHHHGWRIAFAPSSVLTRGSISLASRSAARSRALIAGRSLPYLLHTSSSCLCARARPAGVGGTAAIPYSFRQSSQRCGAVTEGKAAAA